MVKNVFLYYRKVFIYMATVKNKKAVIQKEAEINKRLLTIVAIILVLFGIVAITYAWLTQTITSDNDNVIVTGSLELTLNDENPILKIGGDYGYGVPISDDGGMQIDPYSFTVTNIGTIKAKYSVYLDDTLSYTNINNDVISINNNRISDEKLDYNLRVGSSDSNEVVAKLSTLGNPRKLVEQDTLTPGQSRTYYLRMWIDKDANTVDTYNKVFAVKLRVSATQTENPTIPVGP